MRKAASRRRDALRLDYVKRNDSVIAAGRAGARMDRRPRRTLPRKAHGCQVPALPGLRGSRGAAFSSGAIHPFEQRLPLFEVLLGARGREVEQREPVRGGLHVHLRIAQVADHRQFFAF